LGSVWAILGFSCLIGSAVVRLLQRVMEVQWDDLTLFQWIFVSVFWVFMMFSEGYGGFQKKLAPRFAARAWFLSKHPTMVRIVFAPFFCVGYFQASHRRVLSSFALTGMIVVLVLMVSMLDQPWRGLVDLGVISGLVYGTISLAVYWTGVLLLGWKPVDAELGGSAASRLPAAGCSGSGEGPASH
jgi:hypothetical protein